MSDKKLSTEEMIDNARQGRLSRRQFNSLLTATGVSLFATPVLTGRANA